MASEKAAAEFQLEKELKRLQEAQVWCLLLCFLIHIRLYYGVQSLVFFNMFWFQGEGEWEIWSINHCISDYFSCHWFCLWFWCYIEQVEADRNKVSRRASTSWEEDTEMKALEYVDCFVIIIRHLYMLSLLLLPCQ